MKNSWLCFLTCVVILLTLSSSLLAEEDIVISNELVKKASQLNKFNIIIDSSQEIKNTLETSMCIEFKTYSSYMVCGQSSFITWAKVGYNPNYFKKSLVSILEVIYEEFINF
jgi:hypothetical protein